MERFDITPYLQLALFGGLGLILAAEAARREINAVRARFLGRNCNGRFASR